MLYMYVFSIISSNLLWEMKTLLNYKNWRLITSTSYCCNAINLFGLVQWELVNGLGDLCDRLFQEIDEFWESNYSNYPSLRLTSN